MAGRDDDVVELAQWKARRRAGGEAPVTADETSPLLRVARGELGAVRACVDTYGGLVQGLVRRLLPEDADHDDAVQEVFVALWQSAHRFDPSRASDRGFVAMITRRRVIDRRRKAERQVETVKLEAGRDRPSGEHERTQGRLEAGPALRALNTLPEHHRTWILLSVVEGFSHREVAERTDTPLGTVKSGIRRGLAQVRERLEGRAMKGVGP
jgi:RNA polymerase sigma-70 factor (ECF subfamily)